MGWQMSFPISCFFSSFPFLRNQKCYCRCHFFSYIEKSSMPISISCLSNLVTLKSSLAKPITTRVFFFFISCIFLMELDNNIIHIDLFNISKFMVKSQVL
jgi:hypothetical protein